MKNNYIINALLAVASFAVGVAIIYLVKHTGKGPEVPKVTTTTVVEQPEAKPEEKPVVTPEPVVSPKQDVQPKPDSPKPEKSKKLEVIVPHRSVNLGDDGKTFNVRVKAADWDNPVRFILYDDEHEYFSEDGTFTGVEPSKKGYYLAKAIDTVTKLESSAKAVGGLGKPAEAIDKSKLKEILQKANGSTINDYSQYFCDFDDLKIKGNFEGTMDIYELITELSMTKKLVDIKDICYKNGRITSFYAELE